MSSLFLVVFLVSVFLLVFIVSNTALASGGLFSVCSRVVISMCVAALSTLGFVRMLAYPPSEPLGSFVDFVLLLYSALAIAILLLSLLLLWRRAANWRVRTKGTSKHRTPAVGSATYQRDQKPGESETSEGRAPGKSWLRHSTDCRGTASKSDGEDTIRIQQWNSGRGTAGRSRHPDPWRS